MVPGDYKTLRHKENADIRKENGRLRQDLESDWIQRRRRWTAEKPAARREQIRQQRRTESISCPSHR